MDVYFCLVCWLQVVMDNGQEKKAKQRRLDSGSCVEKRKRESAMG